VSALGSKVEGSNKHGSMLDALVREVSGPRKPAVGRGASAPRTLRAELTRIARRDYGEALRQCLSRWEIREIVGEGKNRVWPALNRAPVTLVAPREFVRRWSGFGVDFKFAPLEWKKGLSLLGFYVKKTDQLRPRPLIFVNTAHHPGLVGVALEHEMGHHLTSRIFGSSEQATHALSLTGFEEHLVDPAELAADTLVSLGIFPAPIAQKLFDKATDKGGTDLSDSIFQKVLGYIANRYQFTFEQIQEAEKKSQALAALVHYTKLRRALLDEYGA
jgi:hypothetical protein